MMISVSSSTDSLDFDPKLSNDGVEIKKAAPNCGKLIIFKEIF